MPKDGGDQAEIGPPIVRINDLRDLDIDKYDHRTGEVVIKISWKDEKHQALRLMFGDKMSAIQLFAALTAIVCDVAEGRDG